MNLARVNYGFSWWLYPYANDDPRLAFGGSGFGGQMPLVLPEYDLVLVFTGWNIAGEKGLGAREAIDRVLAAVILPLHRPPPGSAHDT
jgi:CubicO group peptidase (beta-lactamase class C family)